MAWQQVGFPQSSKRTWDHVIPRQHIDRWLGGIYSMMTPLCWD
jgi:hypothetical protein